MRADRRRHATAVLLLVAWQLIASRGQARQEGAESNLQVMHRLLRDEITDLVDSLSTPRTLPLVLNVFPQGSEEAWFVQTRLFEELSRRGFQLSTAETRLSAEGLELQLRVDELAARLFEGSNSRDSLKREVRVQLSGFLRDVGGKVLWGGVLSRKHTDVIAKKDVARLEESPYEFTYFHGSGEGSGVRRVLESMTLGAALAIITYLFFSYRTR